jgi:hypothetical protein
MTEAEAAEHSADRDGVDRPTRARDDGPGGPPVWLALLLVAAFLALGVGLSSDYGPTWDSTMGEYPYGHRILEFLSTGDALYLDLEDTSGEPPLREPHPDFAVRRKPWYQISCLGGMLSGLTCEVFWHRTGLLPAMEAHNLVNLLLVAWMLWTLAAFARRWRLGVAGLAGGLLLLASPRFFGHVFNNLKDMPEACLYTLSVLVGYGALRTGRLVAWLGCGALAGLAVAQKINGIFIPVQLALVFGLGQLGRGRSELRWSWPGFGAAAVTMLATFAVASPVYWLDPIGQAQDFIAFITNVGNAHTSSGAPVERSGYAMHSVDHVLWTTPPWLLLLGLMGVCRPGLGRGLRMLLLLGMVVPVGRTLLPGMRDFDGVRHFLEFYPMLALSAGVAVQGLAGWVADRWQPTRRPLVAGALTLVVVAPGVAQVIDTHPHGICYFNGLSGGLPGGQERGLADATDYWGHSYWQALEWVDEQLPEGAALLVPVAGHLVESSAPVRLREDILLCRAGITDTLPDDVPLYVMYVTRRNWYPPFLKPLDRTETPVHQVEVQGAPILKILRIEPGPQAQQAVETWHASMTARSLGQRLQIWMASHPKKARQVQQWMASWQRDPVAARAALESLLPPDLGADLDAMVSQMIGGRR